MYSKMVRCLDSAGIKTIRTFNENLKKNPNNVNVEICIMGSVLVYDFWTPPPPINFVHGSDKKFLNLT